MPLSSCQAAGGSGKMVHGNEGMGARMVEGRAVVLGAQVGWQGWEKRSGQGKVGG